MSQLGFHVYAKLKEKNFSVFPICSTGKNIQGDPCFPNLIQLRPFADVVILALEYVDHQERVMRTLRDMRDMGIFRLWIESGCESEEILKFAEEYKLSVVTDFSLAEEVEKM